MQTIISILIANAIGSIACFIASKYCQIDWQRKIIINIIFWSLIGYIIRNFSLTMWIYTLFVLFVLDIGATIDWHTFILPDEGALLLCFGRLLQIIISYSNLISINILTIQLFTAFLWGVFFYLLRIISKNGLGLGDVKWGMAIAFSLPWHLSLDFVSYAFIFGSIFALVKAIIEKRWSAYIPFGPFLSLGAAIAFLFG